jgi:hypothetical protein
VIEAGPLLELGIDGERMIGFIRREVLAQLVAEREGAASAKEEAGEGIGELAARALEALARLGGTAAMSELERATGEKRERLRPVLKGLAEAGRLRRTGERGSARYHLADGTVALEAPNEAELP